MIFVYLLIVCAVQSGWPRDQPWTMSALSTTELLPWRQRLLESEGDSCICNVSVEKNFVESLRNTFGPTECCLCCNFSHARHVTHFMLMWRLITSSKPSHPARYLPPCAPDSTFADIVRVYKFYLLNFLVIGKGLGTLQPVRKASRKVGGECLILLSYPVSCYP